MSWTRSIAPEAATGTVAEAYERARAVSSTGGVANLWRAQALDPQGLAAIHALYRAMMADPSPLSGAQAEMIAVVVSATNGCSYCVSHHGPKLASALGDEALARAVAADYREANLAARDRVLCDHAVALTCEPSERTQADLERLREYGFDDAAIVKATMIAGYYNLTNRLANSLGVELESGVEEWKFGAQR